ncbi:hypothetical protein VP01_2801g2 [Puccinia sorghi]|uniref:Uncharacterized protein n=1 Tax=Puccinia sorghi TaxID=27349 RepID=A0A0L6V390_9BASI|nr:hypothetical protein VP01_2801g2 [Puccinia sorghi]
MVSLGRIKYNISTIRNQSIIKKSMSSLIGPKRLLKSVNYIILDLVIFDPDDQFLFLFLIEALTDGTTFQLFFIFIIVYFLLSHHFQSSNSFCLVPSQSSGYKMVTIADMIYDHFKTKHKSLSMNHLTSIMILHSLLEFKYNFKKTYLKQYIKELYLIELMTDNWNKLEGQATRILIDTELKEKMCIRREKMMEVWMMRFKLRMLDDGLMMVGRVKKGKRRKGDREFKRGGKQMNQVEIDDRLDFSLLDAQQVTFHPFSVIHPEFKLTCNVLQTKIPEVTNRFFKKVISFASFSALGSDPVRQLPSHFQLINPRSQSLLIPILEKSECKVNGKPQFLGLKGNQAMAIGKDKVQNPQY